MQPVRLILASKVGQGSCSAGELKAIGRVYVKSYRNFYTKNHHKQRQSVFCSHDLRMYICLDECAWYATDSGFFYNHLLSRIIGFGYCLLVFSSSRNL